MHTMLVTSLILLALSAPVGVWLAKRHVQGEPPPKASAHLHGALSGFGLLLLFYAFTRGLLPAPGFVGMIALTLAVIGGIALSVIHYTNRRLPVLLIGAHAIIALAGVLFVVAALFMPAPSVPPNGEVGVGTSNVGGAEAPPKLSISTSRRRPHGGAS